MLNLSLLENWRKTQWQGFRCLEGIVDERPCKIVLPNLAPREDARWAWRTEFFNAFPNADVELVKRGYILAYMNVADMFGAPVAMKHFDAFYNFALQLGLNPKTAFIALSRGGLFAYNWTFDNLDKVACIYADAPVCDIRSWPCKTPCQWPGEAQKCLAVYGLTQEELPSKYISPIERIPLVAQARIPIIHVCGDADEVVPFLENTVPLVQNYLATGGADCRVIVKKGCHHHPHGLEDATPVADFIDHAFDILH